MKGASRHCQCGLWGLFAVLACSVASFAATPRPLSPAEELATFHFADSNLVAELVAAEPLVSSPVALAWDAEGRLFVAEMRDYPNAREGGAIRLLEDRDADGRCETASVFADRLPFPNSVLPWNGGVLVTAAPDLWFLRDTDGDGHADERRVLFTGFGTGNQQLRANGLYWGLDGWVYGANGRSDGEIRRVYDPGEILPASARLGPVVRKPATTNAVSLRGRDFRFRPDTGEFESLAGRSQFGLARDDWGGRFLSWNTIPLRHEVFPDRYLSRNPRIEATDVLQDGLPPGDSGQVFPLTPPPLVFNNESGSHFNALSGLHLFRGDALGDGYAGNAFVGESLRNLVHRRVLVPEGPTFRAERGETGREFLASTDPWFHPVNFATGPDGAFHVADFYRQFVEHPDWVAREMRERVDWAAGGEHGRIWRVRRKDHPFHSASVRPGLERASVSRLLEELHSPNGWRRDTAQRLLFERRDDSASPPLTRLVLEAPRPETRVQALCTLEALEWLDNEVVLATLHDPEAHVRAAAAQIIGRRLTGWSGTGSETREPTTSAEALLSGPLAALATDSDAAVRLQVALALGSVTDGRVREPALVRLATATTNRWLGLAAASSTASTNPPWIAMVRSPVPLRRPAPVASNSDPDRQAVVERFRPALQVAGDRRRGAATCATLCLSCHYLQGHGQRVGPDLSGLGTRPAETLLVDLLDPSRQVAPDYAAFQVVTADGVSAIGLIASETETRLTLRHPGSPDESFARYDLREIRATGRSLMPDGLEANLSPADFADLLAFLRDPDGGLLPKQGP